MDKESQKNSYRKTVRLGKKPPAIVSLIKDIKYTGGMSIVGNIKYAGVDSEGYLWIQIEKDNKEMLEAIARLVKSIINEQVKITINSYTLDELVKQYEESRKENESEDIIPKRFEEYLGTY